jgi:hypothetical protein
MRTPPFADHAPNFRSAVRMLLGVRVRVPKVNWLIRRWGQALIPALTRPTMTQLQQEFAADEMGVSGQFAQQQSETVRFGSASAPVTNRPADSRHLVC